MTQALIDNLALIAAAPDGIKALRGLILDLAVRGKLVPQDPKDEPASELLKRIAAEKARLVTMGEIRKRDNYPKLAELEYPFLLPSSWEWCRLGELGQTQTGTTPQKAKPEHYGDYIPFIKPGDIYRDRVDYSGEGLSELGLAESGRRAKSDSILMVCIGTIGKCQRIDRDCAFNQQINSFTPYSELDSRYSLIACRSEGFQRSAWAASARTTIAILNKGNWELLPLPLPPLAEQRRIVAKVDELMVLCDRLEAQQADAESVHAALVKSLLDTLTQSQDADDFAANWQRLSQHFPTIFTTEASVDALKQAVVELAVTGKLVSQSSEDEAASVFLERIKSARARLTPGKITKADKALPALTADALPFCQPFGWEWVRFDEVVLISGGLTLGRTFAGRELVSQPYLRVANVQRGHLALSEVKEVLVPPEEVEKYRLRPHDLLITEGGDWDKVGRTAIWRGEIEDCLHQNHVFKARPFISDFYDRWAELYLNSAVARSYFAGASKQTTNLASINMTQLKACLLPLPPLAEQHRIVAKVDELFALCDSLKAQIAESRAVQRQLATALVEQAVAA